MEARSQPAHWEIVVDPDKPHSIAVEAVGKHALDIYGAFPKSPVGLLKVKLEWFGTDVYIGEFRHGAKNGRGCFMKAAGDKLIGHFRKGIAHGEGQFFFKNGDVFLGTWLHGAQLAGGEFRSKKMQIAAHLLQGNIRIMIARKYFTTLRFAFLARMEALQNAELTNALESELQAEQARAESESSSVLKRGMSLNKRSLSRKFSNLSLSGSSTPMAQSRDGSRSPSSRRTTGLSGMRGMSGMSGSSGSRSPSNLRGAGSLEGAEGGGSGGATPLKPFTPQPPR